MVLPGVRRGEGPAPRPDRPDRRPGHAFRTVRYSEKLLQRSGITVETEDFSEILADIEAINDEAAVQKKVEEIRAYADVIPGIGEEKLIRQAKLCMAIESWMEDHECQASAIQCWDSVEANYGCAMCLCMSMMGQKGLPSACETDVVGAVSMLALRHASGADIPCIRTGTTTIRTSRINASTSIAATTRLRYLRKSPRWGTWISWPLPWGPTYPSAL